MSLTATEPMTPALSRSALMAVRRVLHAYREGWLLDDRLAAAARMIADDAQREGLPAARMIVLLKQAWTALDEVRWGAPVELQQLLSRLLTLSIASYYDRPLSPVAERRISPAAE